MLLTAITSLIWTVDAALVLTTASRSSVRNSLRRGRPRAAQCNTTSRCDDVGILLTRHGPLALRRTSSSWTACGRVKGFPVLSRQCHSAVPIKQDEQVIIGEPTFRGSSSGNRSCSGSSVSRRHVGASSMDARPAVLHQQSSRGNRRRGKFSGRPSSAFRFVIGVQGWGVGPLDARQPTAGHSYIRFDAGRLQRRQSQWPAAVENGRLVCGQVSERSARGRRSM